jgi:hypothetical protein
MVFPKNVISENIGIFGEFPKLVHRSDVEFDNSFVLPTRPAVSGFLNFANQMDC